MWHFTRLRACWNWSILIQELLFLQFPRCFIFLFAPDSLSRMWWNVLDFYGVLSPSIQKRSHMYFSRAPSPAVDVAAASGNSSLTWMESNQDGRSETHRIWEKRGLQSGFLTSDTSVFLARLQQRTQVVTGVHIHTQTHSDRVIENEGLIQIFCMCCSSHRTLTGSSHNQRITECVW